MRMDVAELRLKAWRGLVDFLTPSQCLICHQPAGEAQGLCAACWAGLTHLDEPACNILGTPFTYEQGPTAVSVAALANPPAWDRARAAVAFDDRSRPLVHALKYRDTPQAGHLMARMMCRAGRRLVAEADLILPVPLFRWRLWRRRFNQSAVLAQEIARISGTPWNPMLLVRQRATRSQVGLNVSERRRNVRGAFVLSVDGVGQVKDKTVLLIDDVRTTGATLEACADVLRTAGARQVDVLTFALVLEPARLHN
ncbi:MAG: ComF family protein [Alphaproteobacteria bacterium]|nr:ComF family protein [Alphaproteobacteria bacterium]